MSEKQQGGSSFDLSIRKTGPEDQREAAVWKQARESRFRKSDSARISLGILFRDPSGGWWGAEGEQAEGMELSCRKSDQAGQMLAFHSQHGGEPRFMQGRETLQSILFDFWKRIWQFCK